MVLLRKLFITLTTAVLLCTQSVACASLELVADGEATCVIVSAEDAPGAVAEAVTTLATTLQRMTGSEIPTHVVSQSNLAELKKSLGDRTVLLVGRSAWTRSLGETFTTDKPDSFVIKTVGQQVVILGNDGQEFHRNLEKKPSSAGTLYAAQRFLEELGVRWYLPGEQNLIYPAADDLVLDNLDISEAPYFPYRMTEGSKTWRRWAGYGGDRDPWSTRHSFESLYDWKELFTKSNPEFFCMNDANRLSNNLYHIAFAHEGVVEKIIEQARAYFQSRKPDGKGRYFLVGGNDYFMEMCACDECQALTDYTRPDNGWFSDYIGQAVVRVAEALKDEFPDRRIVYLAYEHYQLPPTKIKQLPSNVVVLLAQSRRMLYLDEEGKRDGYQMIRDWQALRPEAIYFCRYYMWGKKTMPWFFPHVIADDIQQMKQLNEQGPTPILGEMHFGYGTNWWFRLSEYITARCLWNPDLDVDVLLNEFCQDFFGPAAKPMRRYLDFIEQSYLEAPDKTRYTMEDLKAMRQMLDEARTLASDSDWAARVEVVAHDFDAIEDQALEGQRLLASMSSDTSQASVIPAPILEYTFDNSISEVAQDDSGNKHHGMIVGARRVSQSVRGQAIHFDGKDDYIKLRTNLQLDGAYTLEAWVRPGQTDRTRLILGELEDVYTPYHVFGSPAQHHAWDRLSVSIRGGRMNFRDSGLGLARSDRDVVTGQWQHVVGVYTPTVGLSLFVNGELVGYAVRSAERSAKAAIPFISIVGATGGTSSRYGDTIADCRGFFTGEIDEVRVYDQALSVDQVVQRYEQTKPATP